MVCRTFLRMPSIANLKRETELFGGLENVTSKTSNFEVVSRVDKTRSQRYNVNNGLSITKYHMVGKDDTQ